MKFRFFYGGQPKYSQKDAASFSHRGYDCKLVIQNRKGDPVGIFRSTRDGIWKVQDGFSAVFFGTYEEALAYCKGRFLDLDGKEM